ncbi:MAG TPA: PIN domain-containing protein [Candidatus Limnocylindria bacterium]
MSAVIDSGVLYALVDAGDTFHAECLEAIGAEQETIVVPTATIPEVCTLIASRLGSENETAFVRHLVDSDWRLESLANGDLDRVVGMMAEHEIGFADAAVATIAERMNATRIYTLDRRHFERVRPRHVARFELLPAR